MAKPSAKKSAKTAKKTAKPRAKKAAKAAQPAEPVPASAPSEPVMEDAILDDGETPLDQLVEQATHGDAAPLMPGPTPDVFEPDEPLPLPPPPGEDEGDEDEEPAQQAAAQPVAETMPETIPSPPLPRGADGDPPAALPEGNHWAERVAAARSRPVQMEDDAPSGKGAMVQMVERPVSAAPQAGMPTDDLGDSPVHLDEEPATTRAAPAVAQATGEVGLPEQFLTIAIDGQWDDRMERVKPGRMGAAIVGSVLLELAVLGKLRVQRDHYVIADDSTGDADLDAFAAQVAELGPIPTEQVMRKLGRKLTRRIRPWKQRATRHGWLREDERRFLGIFPRSTTVVLNEEVQGKLQNRLVRMLAGGGNPDVKSIALLGLINAAGLLGQMVPSSALAFNEKRISLLLSGRDPLHYRVDAGVRQVQDLALRTILADVRKLR